MHGFTTLFIVASATFGILTSAAPTQPEPKFEKRDQPKGIDVAEYHKHVDWKHYKKSGVDYGYVMATEGDDYKNSYFKDQYYGCSKAGLICGAYHVGTPSKSNGWDQANYFYENGGNWNKDGKTLPGALVLYSPPKGPTCYGYSPSEMVTWIRHFSDRYYSKTGRYPVIATTTDWWKECTKDDTSFSSTNALWQSNKGGHPGGWSRATLLEISYPTETKEGHNKWNGSYESLERFAWGSE